MGYLDKLKKMVSKRRLLQHDVFGNFCLVLKIAPKFPVEHLSEFEMEAEGWEITRVEREAVMAALGATPADIKEMDREAAAHFATLPKKALKDS
jgi:hypothetical protein